MASKKTQGSAHYGEGADPLDLIWASGGAFDFCRGNVIKYVFRIEKTQDPEASFWKALHYMIFMFACMFGDWDRSYIDQTYCACKEVILKSLRKEPK